MAGGTERRGFGKVQDVAKAASEVLRKGISSSTPTRVVNGVVVFEVPPDSPRITTERVKQLESELE